MPMSYYYCRNCNNRINSEIEICPSCLEVQSSSLSSRLVFNKKTKYICQYCGANFYLDEQPPQDSIVCTSCLYNKYIFNYNYKPEPIFRHGSKEFLCKPIKPVLYYGIELEVEYIEKPELRELAEAACSLPNIVFCKRDASIKFGFEIVFHPASFLWWKENISFIEGNVLFLRKEGFRSFDTDTCGIHIHMDKNGFNPTDIQKLHDFFRYNPGFVLMVSQRERKHLERWAGIYNPGDEKVYFKSINKRGGIERHVAINMNPSKTIEMRIFRGTLNTKSFYKNIEFCDALYCFIKEVSTKDCTVENFLKFVIFHKEKYDNLFEFLKNRLMFVGDGV